MKLKSNITICDQARGTSRRIHRDEIVKMVDMMKLALQNNNVEAQDENQGTSTKMYDAQNGT